ncbi:MAG: radical SAM protein [Candidatus Aminicenantes bacterium]|nr:radical SAM protein [Candidatus Aminicenantes bacterium]
MKIIYRTRYSEIANVYIAETEDGRRVEFVESVQPPFNRKEKWVLIISTLFGCPVGCPFCDAGGDYRGKLSVEELLFQIDFLVRQRYPNGEIDCDKFKIQFARMGEPAFNKNIITLLKLFKERYRFRRFIPSISTVAPTGCGNFFKELLALRNEEYRQDFQLQFSLHSTDETSRDYLIPIKKWDLKRIAEYGKLFFRPNFQKIALNFALCESSVIDLHELKQYFDPLIYIIKVTPVNPTFRARQNKIKSILYPGNERHEIVDRLKDAGYEVIVSIGEWEENRIGSNCGQYVSAVSRHSFNLKNGYSYELERVKENRGR